MEGLPDDEAPWFMWKTGTSSGRRDAWAVGHNRRYAIGVWVGRFNGRGDPAFVGGDLAEPLAAQLFALPAVRNNAAPTRAREWVVTSPLPKPNEVASDVQITFPSQNGRF
jgi:membrane carboxypeptidase/penicillin-binding protein PbpC